MRKLIGKLKLIIKCILYFKKDNYIEYIKKDKCKYDSTKIQDYLSIVAIVKNEGLYIREWIEYHLLVGVDKFYIYDNDSTDNIKEILKPYIDVNIVKYIYYPGTARQVPAYNNAIKKFRNKSFWFATIDIDEFIVPISTETIPEFLEQFENITDGIEINWMMYGSNNHKSRTDELVIERFKKRALDDYDLNRHIKTIFNPRLVWFAGVHEYKYFKGKGVDTHQKPISKYFLKREALLDRIRINHYFTKSEEEYLTKVKRGDATGNDHLTMKHFHSQDKNDIEDTTMDKYIPIIKENLEKRYSN